MGTKRKYICSCGKEYTTTEGLNKHLAKEGCPKEQTRVLDVKTGEIGPLKMGRSSGGERVPIATPTKGLQVKLEGGPPEDIPGDGDKKGTPTVSPFAVSLFNMVPMMATIYNTPALWTSFAVAKLRGFKGDLNDFLAMAAMDFWLGREINPFEELTVIFQGIPSSLEEKLALATGGGHEPGHAGLAEHPAEEEDAEPE